MTVLETTCAPTGQGDLDELRVVIVDDHVIFTELLALALRHEDGLRCAGTATGADMALAVVDQVRPDVVVMDVELGDGDGITATAELTRRHPGLRVVVLTARVDVALMRRAADAGACSLLPKNGPLIETLHALRTARSGGLTVAPGLLMQLLTRSAEPDHARLPQFVTLTARERQTLLALSDGLDVRRIAAQQGISPHTCRGHVRRLLNKLGVHSQLEAVAVAQKHGLLRDSAS
ncbi:response regulator transcription factor [Nocardioides panacis]|uniref:response regulator transcription factor n=1 Tax=Nocardioides panacis TaxID=2849501 RepID=UPI0020B23950|nr:response regulator transcription factor [Nocardioides panacis]